MLRPGRSLSFRLALYAAAGSAIALIAAGVIFIALFRQSVERNFDDRLDVLSRALVGASVSGEGLALDHTAGIGEPRFALPQSGWYWQIRDAETGGILATSASLFGNTLPEIDLPDERDTIRVHTFRGPGGRQLRSLERRVRISDDQAFAILIAGDAEALAEDVSRFRNTTIVTLGLFAIILALGAALLIRFGLQPLRNMRAALSRVRRGEAERLEGEYPSEIAPVIDDLNALLRSNREIVDRARTHVGNLAHALKTPLAVLQNEAADPANVDAAAMAAKVREQTRAMNEQITHNLNRARMAAHTNVIGAITPVSEVIEGLARVMRKVHQDKGLMIHVTIPEDMKFRGERHDFEEMVGNLIDNACKWANSHVVIRASKLRGKSRDSMILTVVDDGPGLPEDTETSALSRGERLDESKPGSGLGLSIVRELVRIYDGNLVLESSEVGGLRVRLTLPISTES